MRSLHLAALCLSLRLSVALNSDWPYTVVAQNISDDLMNGTDHEDPDGYDVRMGTYFFFFLSDCGTFSLDTCFLLNGDSPYGMTMLPASPVENSPYLGKVNLTGTVGYGCQNVSGVNYPQIQPKICVDDKPMQWRLGYDEAVVIIGLSPPDTIYCSFTSYVFSQWYQDSARSIPLSEVDFGSALQGAGVMCPDAPARCQIGGSLGTSFNGHMLSQMTTSGSSANEPFALVLTASKKVGRDVMASIERQSPGLPKYLMVYPSDLLNMGTDNDFRDVFTMLMRVAFPNNMTEMEREYYQPKPLAALRVTPKSSSPEISATKLDSYYLYTSPDTIWIDRDLYVMENAPSNDSATPVLTADQLNASLIRLGNAIKSRHGGHYTDSGLLKQWFVKGTECIFQGTMCNLDCPDTLYPLSNQAYQAIGCQLLLVPSVQEALGLMLDGYVDDETQEVLSWGIPTVCAVLFVVLFIYVWFVPPPGDDCISRNLRKCKQDSLVAGCCAPPLARDGSAGTLIGKDGPAPKARAVADPLMSAVEAATPPPSPPENAGVTSTTSEESNAPAPVAAVPAADAAAEGTGTHHMTGTEAIEIITESAKKTGSGMKTLGHSFCVCCRYYRYDLASVPWLWWLTFFLVLIFGFGIGTTPLWVEYAEGVKKKNTAVNSFVAAARATCDDGHLATIDGGPTREIDFYVVYGVNHNATQRARYSSVTIYHYETLSGVMAFSSEVGYEGSAAYYLGDDDIASPYLFARAYSRDCAAAGLDARFCYDVPKTGSPSVPEGGSVMWVTRMYDNPMTHAGPLADQTLMARVAHFD